jgi:hypothetical protein
MKMKMKQVTVAIYIVQRSVQTRCELMDGSTAGRLTRIVVAGLRRPWTVLNAVLVERVAWKCF